jgi:hypothetical protein
MPRRVIDARADPPADAAEILCEPDKIVIKTPVVRTWPDGVHLHFDNRGARAEFSLHHETSAYGTSSGGTLPPGESEGRSAIAPGRILVACVPDPPGDYTDEGVHAAWIRVVDPYDLYVPWELSCGFGEQLRSNVAASPNETALSVAHRVPGVLPTDILKRPKYPESPRYGAMEFIVFRDGQAIARFMGPYDDGAWHMLINACPGTGISKD